MNRPLLIAAFVLLFVCGISMPVCAQHGGGGHAGGGHAGFGGSSMGHGGFSGGGVHSFGGVHSGGFASHALNRGSAFGRGSFGRFGNRSGIGVRIRTYPRYGYNCWGGYCGYGGWGYPYLGWGVDPYWWSDNGDNRSGYDQSAPYGYDDGLADQMQQQGVPMRPAPDYGNQNYYGRSAPPNRPQQQQPAQPAPATVLVFRDQHQEQVQNYAIVGPTLWNFTPGRTQKIPVSDLDVPATEKANEGNGVEFHLPASSEGQ
jgi:hypothetical protein